MKISFEAASYEEFLDTVDVETPDFLSAVYYIYLHTYSLMNDIFINQEH